MLELQKTGENAAAAQLGHQARPHVAQLDERGQRRALLVQVGVQVRVRDAYHPGCRLLREAGEELEQDRRRILRAEPVSREAVVAVSRVLVRRGQLAVLHLPDETA